MTTVRSEAQLQHTLADITALLERHRVLETLTQRLEGPRRDILESLQHRQNLVALQKHLERTHAADVAYILEALPLEDRRTVWEQLPPETAGVVFVEVSDAVRESLVEATSTEDLVKVLSTLDADDLAFISEALPPAVLSELSQRLEEGERTLLHDSIQYGEGAVGHYMTRELVAVPEAFTVDQTLAELRGRGELPPQTDRVFVVDSRHLLRGAVSLQKLLLQDPQSSIATAADESISFSPHDEARDAVKAFERYDLVSAPVVDDRGKLLGRLTVEAAMDVLRDEASLQALKHAGLTGDEDLFGAVWHSARNRWPWLGLNLLTAFVASRIIGQFEHAIAQLSALAALMPIVASIGGNTGNQTMALVIRELGVDRIQAGSAWRLVQKELRIGLLNGLLWGVIGGVFAIVLYSNVALGAVMTGAVILNLLLAALAGVAIPIALAATGRDPAHGSSVLLTFVTDAMGFLLFLGLATVLLM